MSPHNLPVILSPEAQEDYEDIRLYTVERWDYEQWERYEPILVRAIEMLGANPLLGRVRPDLRPDARVLIAGQHVIIYQVVDGMVTVARILHRSRDLRTALDEEF